MSSSVAWQTIWVGLRDAISLRVRLFTKRLVVRAHLRANTPFAMRLACSVKQHALAAQRVAVCKWCGMQPH